MMLFFVVTNKYAYGMAVAQPIVQWNVNTLQMTLKGCKKYKIVQLLLQLISNILWFLHGDTINITFCNVVLAI